MALSVYNNLSNSMERCDYVLISVVVAFISSIPIFNVFLCVFVSFRDSHHFTDQDLICSSCIPMK